MHYIHQTLATDIAADRLREAAEARLVAEARRASRGRTAVRHQDRPLIAAVARLARQALARPALAADASDCR